ncbi:hypothetical protein NVP3058O_047 [Vibrio phage 3.058.O._10N.286.46.B8]|nr:hypothetical protein NVP2058O_048 [Vibrio phage 2.058.O._10N.286.46.B8]AUS03117.1 hypothetical protein NVP3058O_047 [Vibrio phage 3.058.O._10N.286.46.B8]
MKSINLSCGNVIQVDVESRANDVVSWTNFFIAVDNLDGEVWAFAERPSREDNDDVWDSSCISWPIGRVDTEEFSGNYTDLTSTVTFVACLDDIVVTPEPEAKENEVTCLIASEVKVRCPHCQEINDGFCGDPRGADEEFTCEWCEKTYTIHKEADIEMEG